MIYGIGTDIVHIARIERLWAKYGDALMARILHESEYPACQHSKQPARFLAKRFAAKEAFAKAVGTGLCAPVLLTHIAVAHDRMGKPVFVCSDELNEWLLRHHIARIHLSLSDETDNVVAFALAERDVQAA